jgi:hypothetical protein
MQSVTAALLVLDTPASVARAVQIVVALAATGFVVWLWTRREAAFEDKAAGLALAILLATPYSFHYDLSFLGLALFWQAIAASRRGWLTWKRELMAVAWAMPLLSIIVALATSLILTPLLLLGLLWFGPVAEVSIRLNRMEKNIHA